MQALQAPLRTRHRRPLTFAVVLVTAGGSARQKPVLLRDTTMNISAFGEGENRELFVLDYAGGRVRRITGS